MTIYIVVWTDKGKECPAQHFANGNYQVVRQKFLEIREQSKTNPSIEIDIQDISITKHTPKTQVDVVELINKLSK